MKLWGGRFTIQSDDLMRQLNDSFRFDQGLYAADIRGSIAYAGALRRADLLSESEHRAITAGLEQVLAEFDEGRFQPLPSDEDIHTAVERRLTELIGAPGGKLHTGRSRNDQVALDLRLWLMDQIDEVQRALGDVQRSLIDQAEQHPAIIMPGYTHLQPAQPVLFSHWLMSFFWMLERDQARLDDCTKRTAECPLGAGALAGNPFAIDRTALAAELGMTSPSSNSIDAVSDRDFAAEFLFCAAMVGGHVSRLAADLILFSGPGYGFVSIGEQYTTGSSLMPQKRNPDPLELARAKSGRLTGALVGLLTTLKALPSGYNKDLQEDKEPLFDAADTLLLVLPVVAGVIRSLQPHPDAMRAALDPSMLATDLADYLVERGVPFREAHALVGRVVRRAEELSVPLDQLPIGELAAISPLFIADVREVLSYEASISRRKAIGGTAPEAVREQIGEAKARLVSRFT